MSLPLAPCPSLSFLHFAVKPSPRSCNFRFLPDSEMTLREGQLIGWVSLDLAIGAKIRPGIRTIADIQNPELLV